MKYIILSFSLFIITCAFYAQSRIPSSVKTIFIKKDWNQDSDFSKAWTSYLKSKLDANTKCSSKIIDHYALVLIPDSVLADSLSVAVIELNKEAVLRPNRKGQTVFSNPSGIAGNDHMVSYGNGAYQYYIPDRKPFTVYTWTMYYEKTGKLIDKYVFDEYDRDYPNNPGAAIIYYATHLLSTK